MPIQLYDLAAADPRIMFSPFCWRIRMALLHKGLEFEVLPWRFSDRSATAAAGFSSVPVIKDGETWVGDSWDIACYLDTAYPDRPLLMAGAEGVAHARLVAALCGKLIFPAAIRIALWQAYQILDPASQSYFRESREKMFGARLEDLHADEASGRAGLATALAPFDEVLGSCDYLKGDSPAYADYLLFGVLKWTDIVSSYAPIDLTSASGRWFTRLQTLYGGYAADARTVRSR
ncbi:MAG: glutathione S-transferase family protein [Gammaproteobacteria bacterium]